jgi:hypothetical protein
MIKILSNALILGTISGASDPASIAKRTDSLGGRLLIGAIMAGAPLLLLLIIFQKRDPDRTP